MEVNNETDEIDNHLKQLTLVGRLYNTADTKHEQDMLSADYVRVVKWLEEHDIRYHFDKYTRKYVQGEQESG